MAFAEDWLSFGCLRRELVEWVNSRVPDEHRIRGGSYIKAWTDTYLCDADWKVIKGGKVWITPEGVAKGVRYVEAHEIASEFFDSMLLGRGHAPGKAFVADPDRPGSWTVALVPRRVWKGLELGRKSKKRLPVRLERIEDVSGVSWRDERLSQAAGA